MPMGWHCRCQFSYIRLYILSNCGGFLIALHVVTALLEYLSDCSIGVSRYCLKFNCIFWWGGAHLPLYVIMQVLIGDI